MRRPISPMRAEIKYLVPNNKLDKLRQAISSLVTLDKYGQQFGDTGYTVRSIYLDTPGLTYYKEKIEGLKKRKKLRVRAYNKSESGSYVFLEIKRKEESKIAKDRARLAFGDLGAIFSAQPPPALDKIIVGNNQAITAANKFMYHLYKNNLQGINLVVYEREAYEGKINPDLRVTFDKNLRSRICSEMGQLYTEEDMQRVLADHFILEIKYNYQFPSWLSPILSQMGLQKQALSKYCMGLEKCTGLRGQELLLSLSSRFHASPPTTTNKPT